MRILYTLGLLSYRLLALLLSPLNKKAKLWINGQKGIISDIESSLKNDNRNKIWIHVASLGEFEQGKPLIEKLRAEYPNHKIVLTFFSPSGYEVRKNNKEADYTFYLPFDSKNNAIKFIEIVNPQIAFFVKYEFWHFYFNELHKKNIPLLSISSIFRKDQLFFKSYGNFHRNTIKKVTHFFVQNNTSFNLLKSININNVQIVGDTRFDRVRSIKSNCSELPFIEKFKNNSITTICGSTWEEDINMLIPLINQYKDCKFIIAPHEINLDKIKKIQSEISQSSLLYSELESTNQIETFQVLIVDCIGLLTSIYRYADIAYVGGAFGKGLHNTLEPATFGVPIFFGNKFKKFQEAKDLVQLKGAFSFTNYIELQSQFSKFIESPDERISAGKICSDYIAQNIGATDKIIDFCKKEIKL